MANEKNCIISLQGVSKVFDGTTVVDEISLDITKGEFVTILGPSGCGKSTTLRMLGGFEMPDKGTILLNGQDITKIPPYLRPINTVFQRYALFPYLDVYDNVAFGLKLKKIPYEKVDRKGNKVTKMRHLTASEIDKKVARALKIVDLEELENRDISTLSGGQQQRVAIARAIVNEPEILLLDEPLGALDLKMRKEMQLELKEMHKKLGITFIYVTHDQEEALTMSDTIVVMKSGEIQQIGTPKEIYNEPVNAYVANFIGESNIYNATMAGKYKVRFLNHVFECVDDFPTNEKVDVVIRPEDVILKKHKKDETEKVCQGVIANKIFKGVHFEYVVMVGKNEIIVQDTKEREVEDIVTIDVDPDNIHIMKKDVTVNTYSDAWINKENKVMISEDPFDCDITQLLPDSHIDEEGYLVSKDGKKYDLNDADVIASVGLNDIEIIDGYDNGQSNGEIVSIIYKGDHYQVMVRTEEEEDFIVDTLYSWNENDMVSVSIKAKDIKLVLKGDISKYEIKD
ncbi:MAG: ATP-binding cassette domain-containing protein [Bacilli bacterium]|nr:ATP-binding cassette domain-containing protein [Bacilli bacterium]